MSNKIKVLVVDDSALMRKLLTDLLNTDRGIEVVGSAKDAYDARDKIKALDPDVLTLDVEMPKMDGLKFLENLMRLRPMPVIMVSTLTEKGADVTMRALELGAIDYVSKPKVDVAHTLEDYSAEIVGKVKVAASARVKAVIRKRPSQLSAAAKSPLNKVNDSTGYGTTDRIIAIGASTGGTEAIKDVLIDVKPDCPGIVITQHIPPVFSRSFADRMNNTTALNVCEAVDGQKILSGHAYIAPGDQHMEVFRDGAFYRCRVRGGELVNRHMPAVDVLFDSVAKHVAGNAYGVILTGMGKDGALGLKRMREAGAPTVAQDEASSVVWGMPGAAVSVGGAEHVLPLNKIAAWINTNTRK